MVTLPVTALLLLAAPGLGPEGPKPPSEHGPTDGPADGPADGVARAVTVSHQPTNHIERAEPEPAPEPEPPPVLDDEPAPILAKELEANPRWAARDRHGFAWNFDLGLNVVPLGIVDGLGAIPQGRLSFFFGGSLPTRKTSFGYRKVALGAVSEIDMALPVHRHHFGVDFQAGKHGRFFARTHAGMSFVYTMPAGGLGARMGMAVRPRGRKTDFVFGLSTTIDASVYFVWPTVGLFFGAMGH